MNKNSGTERTESGTERNDGTAVTKATKRLIETLPRGVRIGTWPDNRPKRFWVRYGPDRKLESFPDQASRNTQAELVAKTIKTEGANGLEIRTDEVVALKAFLDKTGVSLELLAKAWNEFSGKPLIEIKTSVAVERYLKLRVAEDIKAETNTYRQMRRHLRDYLCAVLGDENLADVTTDDLRSLLAGVRDRDGKGEAAPITKRSYRKNWMTFFTRAVAEKWITKNPCALVIPPKVVETDKELFAVEKAFQFLKANLEQPCVPRIALEMWGFMRASSAARVEITHLNFAEKGLRMPAPLHKSGKGKFRQGHAPVLWKWLALATAETWNMDESMYSKRKAQAFLRAGIEVTDRNVHNVLRHSCISYHLAAHRSMEQTSYLAQHSAITMTENYEGIALQRDGLLWEKLTPEAVRGSWETFLLNQNQ